MKKIFVILGLALLLASCQSRDVRLVERVAVRYAESGKPWVIYYYEVVGKDSTCVEEKWFHENGILSLEGRIVDGKREGVFKGYYPTGELMSVGKFVKGQREGQGKIYFRSGKVNVENMYRNGEPYGVWKYYDEAGNITDVKEYK